MVKNTLVDMSFVDYATIFLITYTILSTIANLGTENINMEA